MNVTFDVVAYPNPSQSFFNLKIVSTPYQGKTGLTESVEISIYDASGRLMDRLKGSPTQIFRFGDRYIAGMYMVEVRQGDQKASVKVVKQ